MAAKRLFAPPFSPDESIRCPLILFRFCNKRHCLGWSTRDQVPCRFLLNVVGGVSVGQTEIAEVFPKKAEVFLLAQNRLLREALGKVLSRRNDVVVVGSCAFSNNSTQEIIAESPDVLVMDSFAATPMHLEFVRNIQERQEHLKLLMIGMEAQEQQFLFAIQEGVLGYVLKDASAAEVVTAVRTVANGEGVCPPQFCAFLFRQVANQRPLPSLQLQQKLGLTNREQQLVWSISRGLTNKEIANELHLAEQTVRNHVHRILRKLGASHRLAIPEICRTQGLSI